MHRLQSRSSIFRFRLSSLLLWLAVLSFASGFVVMAFGLFHSMERLVVMGARMQGTGLTAYISEWMLSSRAKCPLCMTPPLHPKYCQKNRRAKRLFGSYRLRVATNVLFRNYFQCPYCGDATKIAMRERPTAGRIDSP